MSQAEETLFVSWRGIHWQRSKSSGKALNFFKKEYDAQVECLKGKKTRYDAKRKKFTPQEIGNLCYTVIAK